ncbi:triacylglycerol lipase, partial [Ancylostoma ceylanicum]
LVMAAEGATKYYKYIDHVARQKFFPLAAAAYSSSSQECITNKYKNATIAVHSTVGCDPAPCASCAGFIALLHADKAITLSFRGTNTLAQLVKETEQTLFHKKIPWIAGGYVSKYFHNAFNAVWNGGIKDKFEDLLKTYPAYAIWVTGHSLGGSMASLAASYIVANGYVNASKVKLVTFGQPRTGDSDYARALNEKVPYSFRIVHRRDIIPHFPLTCKNYSHHDSE